MTAIDIETKRKLREMGATALLDAIDAQDETHVLGMSFEDRLQLVVDEAHSTFNQGKVEGLIRRAGLRYPGADLRRLDLVEERGLDRNVIAQLATCSFIQRQQNVVFQGFTGSGKSYLGCALAKQACQHRIRAHYIRMPDLEEAWALAKDKSQGQAKFLRKYSTFSLLVIDEWLLDHPDEGMRSMLLELLELRYDTGSTVFCTQYAKKD
ncbi:ATP-binding protein, partial [Brachybacterium sp. AOP35-5H-19]